MIRKRRRILQPRKQRQHYVAPLWLAFQRWLGRPLNAPERKIIYTLENHRRREDSIRAIVVDRGNYDSKKLLKDYCEWLMEVRYPVDPMALVANTRKEAFLQSLGMRRKPLLGYHTRQYGLRGRNYDIALMLGAHAYHLNDGLMQTVAGTVGDRGVIIIHSDRRQPREYPRAYDERNLYDPPPEGPHRPPTEAEVEIIIFLDSGSVEGRSPGPSPEQTPGNAVGTCAAAVAAPKGKTAKRTLT